ncbi:MAG: hypothetical protein AAF465_12115 [Pseudomonadota bacterium]
MTDTTPNETELSHLYKATRTEMPPASLDAAILAQAKEANEPTPRRPAWLVPVGLAATVLLGVNVATTLNDHSAETDVYSTVSQPAPRTDSNAGGGLTQPIDAGRVERQEVTADTAASKPSQAAEQPTVDAARAPKTTPLELEASGSPLASEARSVRAPVPQPPTEVVRSGKEDRFTVGSNETMEVDEDNTRAPAADSESAFASTSPNDAPVVESESTSDEQVVSMATPPGSAAPSDSVESDDPLLADERSSDHIEFEEILVTGSRVPDEREHRFERPTAKGQALKNARQRSLTEAEQSSMAASAVRQPAPPVYVCDLDALGIDAEVIERAKVAARLATPKRDAMTWLQYIRQLGEDGEYTDACAQLAAYRALFPDLVIIMPLPVTLDTPAETP